MVQEVLREVHQEPHVAPRAVKAFWQPQKDHPDLVNPIACNITIDAGISNKDMATAETLLEETQRVQGAILATLNTLIKDNCQCGDRSQGKACLQRLQRAGFELDAACFCCILGLADRSLNLGHTQHFDQR